MYMRLFTFILLILSIFFLSCTKKEAEVVIIQEKEIDLSINFLKKVGAPTENWVMCYPYGAHDDSLIEILKKKKCKLALTTRVDIASLNKDNAYTLERLDTNDLPKVANAETNSWTKKVLI